MNGESKLTGEMFSEEDKLESFRKWRKDYEHLLGPNPIFFYNINITIRSKEDVLRINEMIRDANDKQEIRKADNGQGLDIPLLELRAVLKKWKQEKAPFKLKIGGYLEKWGSKKRKNALKFDTFPLTERNREDEKFEIIKSYIISGERETDAFSRRWPMEPEADFALVEPVFVESAPESDSEPLLNVPMPSPGYFLFSSKVENSTIYFDFADLINGRVVATREVLQETLNRDSRSSLNGERFVFEVVEIDNRNVGLQIFDSGPDGTAIGDPLPVDLNNPDDWLRFFNIDHGFFPYLPNDPDGPFPWHDERDQPNDRLIRYLLSRSSTQPDASIDSSENDFLQISNNGLDLAMADGHENYNPPDAEINGSDNNDYDFMQMINNNMLNLSADNSNTDFLQQINDKIHQAMSGGAAEDNDLPDSAMNEFDDRPAYDDREENYDDPDLTNLIRKNIASLLYDAHNMA